MEQEINQTRRQLTELLRLEKANEARESECLRLRNKIQSLSSSVIRSANELKEESTAYRKWRKEKETEFDPELVLVSAGYDSSFVCPVGGSYLNTLSESVGHTLSALLGDPMKPINP
ncbi:unnamed protein product, partial [Schistosoma haematobium]